MSCTKGRYHNPGGPDEEAKAQAEFKSTLLRAAARDRSESRSASGGELLVWFYPYLESVASKRQILLTLGTLGDERFEGFLRDVIDAHELHAQEPPARIEPRLLRLLWNFPSPFRAKSSKRDLRLESLRAMIRDLESLSENVRDEFLKSLLSGERSQETALGLLSESALPLILPELPKRVRTQQQGHLLVIFYPRIERKSLANEYLDTLAEMKGKTNPNFLENVCKGREGPLMLEAIAALGRCGTYAGLERLGRFVGIFKSGPLEDSAKAAIELIKERLSGRTQGALSLAEDMTGALSVSTRKSSHSKSETSQKKRR